MIMNSRPTRRLSESVIEVLHRDYTIYFHLTSLDDNGSFCCRKFDIRKESCVNKNANGQGHVARMGCAQGVGGEA